MEIDELPVINDHSLLDVEKGEIPTIDEDVRIELRKLGEPITYFGEGKAERRARLIKLVSEGSHTNFRDAFIEEDIKNATSEDDEEEEEDFYTPGTDDLLEARKWILDFSLKRASHRVQEQQKKSHIDFIKVLKHRRNVNTVISSYESLGTQMIPDNTRALSAIRYSRDSSLMACGSWDGSLHILGSSDLNTRFSLRSGYHTEKVSAIDWDTYTESNLLISGGNEGNINIWKINEDNNDTKLRPEVTINSAHNSRISKSLFHPSGKFIASTSFDQKWKLWDIEKPQKEILDQEGHSKEVFAGSFHPDGGLFTTGGLDGVGRIWDLRSGRSISVLQGHAKGIYSLDWSPNGIHLVTASGDCSIKVWDIRKLDRNSNEIFTIPAHKKLVSDVQFFNRRGTESISKETSDFNDMNREVLDSSGTFLISSSYDGLVNIWSADNWILVKSLQGHNDKVMSCDISGDGRYIASCGWDRSVKLWGSTYCV